MAAKRVTVPLPALMIPPLPEMPDCTSIKPPASLSVEVESTWIAPVSVKVARPYSAG